MSERAFTVVELLVVTALIAVLAGMLFPIFSSALKSPRASRCASNLHQIGIGVDLYTADTDGIYPLATSPLDKFSRCGTHPPVTLPLLQTALSAYVVGTEIWHCPSDVGIPVPQNGVASEVAECDLPGVASLYREYGSSYVYRSDLGIKGVSHPAELYDPYLKEEHGLSDVAFLYDSHGGWHGGRLPAEKRYTSLFADGHVLRIGIAKIADIESWVPR